MLSVFLVFAAVLLQPQLQLASAACTGLEWNHTPPKARDGWYNYAISTSLSNPRHMVFDSKGALLVVDRGSGIVAHNLEEDGEGCISVDTMKILIPSDTRQNLNHGIALSDHGKLLFASTATTVYVWDYDAETQEVSNRRTVITGMNAGGHTTRTLFIPKSRPGVLLVSMGSDGNIDPDCLLPFGGCSIKMFSIGDLPSKPYDFRADGEMLGWGLRNSVGVGESADGQIWSVENSVDNANRLGRDIHQDNPGEEMNNHGKIRDSTNPKKGRNFGYPTCFAAWDDNIPNSDIEVGEQFIMRPNATFTDETCQDRFEPPSVVFQAHTAPLDIKFFTPPRDFDCDGNAKVGGLRCNTNGSAIVTFHGSWNRDLPIGYSVGVVPFDNSGPAAKRSDRDAVVQIMEAADVRKCPEDCFRPVGVAIDGKGRIFVSSDSTGAIAVLGQNADDSGLDRGGNNDDDGDGGSGATSSSSLKGWLIGSAVAAGIALNMML